MSRDEKFGRIAVLLILFLLVGAALLWFSWRDVSGLTLADPGSLTPAVDSQTQDVAEIDKTETTLDPADKAFICRAAIAAMMGRDIGIISATFRGDGLIGTSYKRPSDGKRWQNVCRLDGSRIIWASLQESGAIGRFRTNPADEKISYELSSGKVTILQDFGGGSILSEDFSRTEK